MLSTACANDVDVKAVNVMSAEKRRSGTEKRIICITNVQFGTNGIVTKPEFRIGFFS